jgi:3'-phosphoadenosine 5'-phosphosulfate sulfotransferase (PAPS reductase)/FAD synthetase
MTKVRQVVGISGGKDSSALAIYLTQKYPNLEMEYYTCDTGKELEETYQLVRNLEACLGVKVQQLNSAENSHRDPFDHFLQVYGGFLPSSTSRWCTKKLKLDPFEKYVGSDPVISYVGIRGDEDREGYISTKTNIQSIFPFRRNIWSEDVVKKVLGNNTIEVIGEYYKPLASPSKLERVLEVVNTPLSTRFNQEQKLNSLLDLGVKEFNHVVFKFIKEFTEYPLSKVDYFPLLDNEDILVRDDIFEILRNSGVGVPEYYEKREYEVDGKKGYYSRSRSGCFFCFFQQKIEWVWLYEQHPTLFQKALEYEKEGYAWNDSERLEELIKPERIHQIKSDHLKRSNKNNKSPYLLDILEDAEGEGCAACFI